MQGHTDYAEQISERSASIAELEQSIEVRNGKIENYKVQLEAQMKEVKKIAEEKNETVASIVGAQHEKRIADTMSGISEDRTSEDLERMRQMRQKITASASVASEMAGIDDANTEAQFLDALGSGQAEADFGAAIFGPDENDAGIEAAKRQDASTNAPVNEPEVKLPEH